MRDTDSPAAEDGTLGAGASGIAGEMVAGTLPAYLVDPYQRTLATVVVATGADEIGSFAVLADTLLYPGGGGQPPDRGTLVFEPSGGGFESRQAIVDVRKVGTDIRHYLAELGDHVQAPIHLELDWSRRFDHMQQHTAQHLLTAIAQDTFGWPTTSFHLGAEMADIELDVPSLSPKQVEDLEEAVASEIRAAHPVRVRFVDPNAFAGDSVRTRGLPANHVGAARIVQIDGIDACACGGTHLANTAQIECLKLLHTEPMRGGTRLYFVAGARARRRLGAHEARMARLRSALGTPDEGIADAVDTRLAVAAETARRLGDAERQLAGALALQHAAGTGRISVARVDAALVGPLAQAYSRLAAQPLLLVAALEPSGPFSLASGLGSGTDVQVAGHTVAAILGGRGGGSGQLFQGKGDRLDRLEEAGAALAGVVINGAPSESGASAGETGPPPLSPARTVSR